MLISTSFVFNADDTLIMASTAAAAEIILQHIELESNKYNMKLNYGKCIHLRMNDIERVTYLNGEEMSLEHYAIYLGGQLLMAATRKHRKLDFLHLANSPQT